MMNVEELRDELHAKGSLTKQHSHAALHEIERLKDMLEQVQASNRRLSDTIAKLMLEAVRARSALDGLIEGWDEK